MGSEMCIRDREDIVNKSGAWYAYGGSKIGQGRENAKTYLKEHPDVMAEIEEKVREKFSKETKTEDEESVFVDEQAEVTTEADNNAGETEA